MPPAARGFVPLLSDAVRMTWRADRRGFMGAAALQFFGALAPTALVLIGQYLISALIGSHGHRPSLGAVLPPVAALAITTSLVAAAGALQQQQQRLLAERVAADTWERVLDVTGRVSLEDYETPQFFDQLQRIRNNALSQPIGVTTAVFGLIGSTVGVVGLVAVVLAIAPLLVPVMLLAGLPTVLLSRRVSKLEFRFLVRATPIYRARQYLRDVLSGREEAKEIRVFAAESALRQRHAARRQQYESILAAHTRTRILYALVSAVFSSVFLALTLGVVVWMLISGRIPLASGAAAVLAVRFLATGLDQLFRAVGGLFESSAYLADLDDFVHRRFAPEEVSRSVAPLHHRVEVRRVDFTYPETGREVLHDVTLTVGAGEVVALVGENGSGKTTLAKVVAGLYAPTAGNVTWDGADYGDLDARAVQRQVSVIFQDFVRYQLSALDNIGLGDPDNAEDEVAARDAATRAGALDFLEDLPKRLQTVLSREYDHGADLSGGQWQRVALARALRKDASLVILDEPSAALDPRAEAQLFHDVRRVLAGRAALLISHRFSSVRLADRIYVLRDGRVVEHGDHGQLIAAGGLYAELYRLQAAAYLQN